MNLQANSTIIRDETYSLTLFIDPHNKRIRVDDFRGDDRKAIVKAEEMAQTLGLEKLIVKTRREQFLFLLEKGYECEAMIDRYFLGSDCYFFCKYFSLERRKTNQWLIEDGIAQSVKQLSQKIRITLPPQHYQLKRIGIEDAESLAKIYQKVFKIYPTPLHDHEYIKKTLAEGTIYYAFHIDGEIVSAASAEVNAQYQNAELTDCATLPNHRKHGLLRILLEKLEEQLVLRGVYCSYSIARAASYGMNAALHQLGYHYRGRLMNNCYIYEDLESMNVWVKDLTRRMVD